MFGSVLVRFYLVEPGLYGPALTAGSVELYLVSGDGPVRENRTGPKQSGSVGSEPLVVYNERYDGVNISLLF